MSASIRQRHPDAQIELVPGRGGIFNVDVDGLPIWNKHEQGGFPDHDVILDALQGR